MPVSYTHLDVYKRQVCDRKDIDWEALRFWLEKYDDPTDKGMVNSPIQFMYLYLYYTFNK